MTETLETWARAAAAKVAAGAVFFWDREMWPDTKWLIYDDGVRVVSGRTTLYLGELRDNGDALEGIKARARFMIGDAS